MTTYIGPAHAHDAKVREELQKAREALIAAKTRAIVNDPDCQILFTKVDRLVQKSITSHLAAVEELTTYTQSRSRKLVYTPPSEPATNPEPPAPAPHPKRTKRKYTRRKNG